jgi:hypothetical protein
MGLLRSIVVADQEYRRMSAESEAKRLASVERRRSRARAQRAEAEGAVSGFDRYVRGRTGADVLKAVLSGGEISRETYDKLTPELQAKWQAALTRQERDEEELREIAENMGFVQTYLLGTTASQIRANRRRLAAKERREERAEWLHSNRDVLAEEANKTPWWRFTDDEFDKAQRRALKRRQRRYDPDSEFQED